jgi:hypothetical protein
MPEPTLGLLLAREEPPDRPLAGGEQARCESRLRAQIAVLGTPDPELERGDDQNLFAIGNEPKLLFMMPAHRPTDQEDKTVLFDRQKGGGGAVHGCGLGHAVRQVEPCRTAARLDRHPGGLDDSADRRVE